MEALIFGDTWSDSMKDYIRRNNHIASNSNTCVTMNHVNLELPCGQHNHEGYEFLIPVSGMRNLIIGNNEIPTVEKNGMYQIPPGVFHGLKEPLNSCRFFDVTIEERYFKDMERSVFGNIDNICDDICFTIDNDLKILLTLFIDEFINRQTGYELILDNLSIQIAIKLLRNLKGFSNPPKEVTKPLKVNIDAAIEFLYEYSNTDFSLEDVAKTANLSSYYFARVFKSQTGKTVYHYLMDIKIKRAKELLTCGQANINEVCYLSGFKNHSHFTSVFKNLVGVSPTEYRKLANRG